MQWRANPFFGDKREILGALYKMLLFNNASGNQYFFEILRTSLTVKNSKNVVKSECLEKLCEWRTALFLKGRRYIRSPV